ncbi:putative protein kinase RLK-Pelle-LRR-XII-1 family [Helianthus annuus]|uniref:non-specific serine/threonine protein kinase n=2 Tax=Helianthus annuus TaxID=4232 RepID=A0A251TR31_HELAN|nr:putative protein kinase RLK-Pelle-LRR-XII-1 family [Helianthus annuus]KAJ0524500.1 putative protein kinase RLK-Pelle-LRR-XII-1 family [Helianthus annuus]KAJ0540697.1 putative protein kinase RLK-Pelle-LRR-XII-1 family [Helianthus annuus]KAJ0705844.1 putative protein kinase RLK-Pelle-LRR-XII-1 family [Helianthus annuus]KAJ0709978.1 putative protein kinase RLK-Pelle-LRR-XII-1 family [Helianthus annuus]
MWQGVTCGLRHQRVTSLNLTGKDLEGSLSPFLGNLSFLRSIILDNNRFHGSIPLEISSLSRLEKLSFMNNSFTGEIPANISSCSKLWLLNLVSNKLYGKIPNIFSSLRMMKTLLLSANNFTGGIPPSIGNLTYLEELFLTRNPLGGSIPDSFNQLKELRQLGFGRNGLIGEFPMFFYNLSMLGAIGISGNQLHGNLPTNICLNQPHLWWLVIDTNHFSGFLPPSISNCSELEQFDASINDFKGGIKIDFGKLQKLRNLGLGANSFEADCKNLFDSLSNCSNLETLELGENRLTGVLPNSLGNFSSKLSYIGLSLNYVSGSLPSPIGSLFGLTEINLALNNFTGMIPESIGKLQNMERLYLDSNAFTGIIPPSIGNLSSLTELRLGANKLEGIIPSTLSSCKKLLSLDLYNNKLRGSVPKEIFHLSSLSIVLDLSENNLSGALPQEIGNLRNLGYLDLSENVLSGELPSGLSSCISLQTLNLSSNFFHGLMPEEFRSLRGLEYVNLSRNNFSGPLPTYLQEMDLKFLDLSYNNFEGELYVKGVFANTSTISITGNRKLCNGILDLHLPKCTTSDSKRSNRKLSVRVVVFSLSSTVLGLALVSFLLFYFCKKKNTDKPSDAVSIESFEKISYARLFKATEGFCLENLIGTGSFASVYKGVLIESGLTVAIKVLNLNCRGGIRSFTAECDALRNIRHRNLVKVITSCSSIDFQGNDFKALVYDFMPNGSLESWLHAIKRVLGLAQRIKIIKDVACALDYLHCHCGNVVVHCDLKPSNILLDTDMVAHVGDFGLAKILSLEGVPNANNKSSSVFRGTIGYAPPEYGLGSEVSTNGDIYSFGILLLEMMTGKKPVDPMFEEGLTLHLYSRNALADGSVLHIMDPLLLNEDVDEKGLISLVKIGVQCSSESPKDRMDIGTVLHELFSITVTT